MRVDDDEDDEDEEDEEEPGRDDDDDDEDCLPPFKAAILLFGDISNVSTSLISSDFPTLLRPKNNTSGTCHSRGGRS